MNRKIIIAGVIGIAFLVIVIAVLLVPQDKSMIIDDNKVTPTQGYTGATGASKYQDFVRSGRSEICTFATNIDNASTTGTVYASNGKIRADFAITKNNGTFQQHLVVDSYVAYMWTNVNKKGLKFNVRENDQVGYESLRNNPAYNYTCRTWSPDMSVFEIPVDIAFTEITDKALKDIERLVSPAPNP